jgi:hypothetical protein
MPDDVRQLPRFQHAELPAGPYIRIVHLKPDLDILAPIRCTVVTTRLTPSLDYTALSYCWETRVPTAPIECNGKRLLVPPNCEAALRRLRRKHRQRLLWIDSICIDQSRDAKKERGHQVALMGDIYKSASSVIVWLGESDFETNQAFLALLDLGAAWVAINDEKSSVSEQESEDLKRKLSEPSIKGLSSVFRRPWFYRLWTVQEVTLPRVENVIVYCGDFNYPWLQILYAASYLRVRTQFGGWWDEATRLQRHVSGRLLHVKAQSAHMGTGSLLGRYAPLHNEVSPQSVLFILTTAREKQATFPEDRVLALYSLLKELGVTLPAPDYDKSVSEIYTDASVACMEADQSLDILLEVSSDVRRPDLPSWVPDWSSPAWDLRDARRAILRGPFSATGTSRPLWYVEDGHGLATEAMIVDSIHAAGPPLNFSDTTDQHMRTKQLPISEIDRNTVSYDLDECAGVLRAWIKLATENAAYSDIRAKMDAFLRMVFYDGLYSSHKQVELSLFMQWWDILNGDDPLGHNSPVSVFEARLTLWSTAMDLSTRLSRLSSLRCARNKSFFTTERKLYGVAARTVREGDKVALIAGVRVPVILRDVGAVRYQYIGYASVDEYMDGDAWDADKTDVLVLV